MMNPEELHTISSGSRVIDLDGKMSNTLPLIEDRSLCAFSAERGGGRWRLRRRVGIGAGRAMRG